MLVRVVRLGVSGSASGETVAIVKPMRDREMRLLAEAVLRQTGRGCNRSETSHPTSGDEDRKSYKQNVYSSSLNEKPTITAYIYPVRRTELRVGHPAGSR